MDFWLVLVVFIAVIRFLNQYYQWLINSKGVSPVNTSRLISMSISIIMLMLAYDSNAPWLFILGSILIFVYIIISNINMLRIKHGLLTTLWQLLICALVFIFIMII